MSLYFLHTKQYISNIYLNPTRVTCALLSLTNITLRREVQLHKLLNRQLSPFYSYFLLLCQVKISSPELCSAAHGK